MSKTVLGALIIGAAILLSTGAWIYFSPVQTCIRGKKEYWAGTPTPPGQIEALCAADAG